MRKGWVAFGVVVVLAVGGTGIYYAFHDTGPAKTATTVTTVAADTGDVTVQVAATGTVQPSTTRSLSFSTSGTVETVKVRPGSKVQEGDTLATIDDSDATTAVDNAQSNLDKAEDQLTTARAASVKATEEVSAAAAASRSAAAAAAAAKAHPSASKSGGSKTSPGTRTTATPAPSATAKSSQGTSGGGQNGGGNGTDAVLSAQQQVNQDTLTLEQAEATLDGTTITAPIAGTILTVSGKVGTQVGNGSTFITLADTYHWEVSASFPEADAGGIKIGQTATVGLADQVGVTFPAKVIQVDPVGTTTSNLVTYGVLLAFTKAPSQLLVGQSAQVTVKTGSVSKTLRVPTTAVHGVADGKGTVLVRSGTTSTQTTVQVGLQGDTYTQITGGLSSGAQVVRSW